jgi:hypothetical protein
LLLGGRPAFTIRQRSEPFLQDCARGEKIKAADLSGSKSLKTSSAQDEEAQESPDPEEANAPKPGEPIFLYVSRISNAEKAKALRSAVQQATREAKELANAAEADIGPLETLELTSSERNPYTFSFGDLEDGDSMEAMFGGQGRSVERLRAALAQEATDGALAAGANPAKVVYRVTLSASFGLKRPGGK